ncbi:MAG: ribonuclease H-like domain-containing protein [Nitrospirae bacterium]|nr:ribonuclease H-like domain-containing protein [Nitrospirota bacterium]
MIKNTFSILNGIGEKLEKRLWRSGILTWDDFLNSSDIGFISPPKKIIFDDDLSFASQELDKANAAYFAASIKRRDHWRLFDIFKQESVCLDIETNGLMPDRGGYVTVIGLYNGYDYKSFVRGNGLTSENLNKELSGYKYLITFYGAAFDVPFLMRSMPNMKFDIPHFDLCFGARRLGLHGGLKRLESDIGIKRHEDVRGLNGYDAIKLWDHAKKGDSEALDLLVMYNREDTVNLFDMADVIYRRLRIQTGIEEYLNGRSFSSHYAFCD